MRQILLYNGLLCSRPVDSLIEFARIFGLGVWGASLYLPMFTSCDPDHELFRYLQHQLYATDKALFY